VRTQVKRGHGPMPLRKQNTTDARRASAKLAEWIPQGFTGELNPRGIQLKGAATPGSAVNDS
jgi:hypothetical protein